MGHDDDAPDLLATKVTGGGGGLGEIAPEMMGEDGVEPFACFDVGAAGAAIGDADWDAVRLDGFAVGPGPGVVEAGFEGIVVEFGAFGGDEWSRRSYVEHCFSFVDV